MTLTKERKQAYFDADGEICPFCNGSYIEGEQITIDKDRATQEVRCLDCGKYWVDTYKLVAVEEEEE